MDNTSSGGEGVRSQYVREYGLFGCILCPYQLSTRDVSTCPASLRRLLTSVCIVLAAGPARVPRVTWRVCMMKLRQLESLLEDVDVFDAPNFALEQYPTSAHIAARILHTAHGLGDVEDNVVVDLGCGGGVLAIAAQLMGAPHVVRSLCSGTRGAGGCRRGARE